VEPAGLDRRVGGHGVGCGDRVLIWALRPSAHITRFFDLGPGLVGVALHHNDQTVLVHVHVHLNVRVQIDDDIDVSDGVWLAADSALPPPERPRSSNWRGSSEPDPMSTRGRAGNALAQSAEVPVGSDSRLFAPLVR
jgi:hypothetical protein